MRKRWLALTLGLIGMALPAPAHAAVPVNVTRPAITGGDSSLYPGSVLTETPAVWNGAPTSVAIQWQACRGDATSVCSSIAGATGQTYTIQLSDVGAVIRTQEVASNADGASLPAPGVNGTTQVLPPPRPPLPPPPASVTRPRHLGPHGRRRDAEVDAGHLERRGADHARVRVDALPSGVHRDPRRDRAGAEAHGRRGR